jgi:hypothetical protein
MQRPADTKTPRLDSERANTSLGSKLPRWTDRHDVTKH